MRSKYLKELQHYRMTAITKKVNEATLKLEKQTGVEMKVTYFDEL
jgi:hypothetical protein